MQSVVRALCSLMIKSMNVQHCWITNLVTHHHILCHINRNVFMTYLHILTGWCHWINIVSYSSGESVIIAWWSQVPPVIVYMFVWVITEETPSPVSICPGGEQSRQIISSETRYHSLLIKISKWFTRQYSYVILCIPLYKPIHDKFVKECEHPARW